jgi:hypothetical protein
MQPIVMPAASAFSTFSIRTSRSTRFLLPPDRLPVRAAFA